MTSTESTMKGIFNTLTHLTESWQPEELRAMVKEDRGGTFRLVVVNCKLTSLPDIALFWSLCPDKAFLEALAAVGNQHILDIIRERESRPFRSA